MALQIISVLLFTVFFSKALTLQCYNCTTAVPSGSCNQTANCSSPCSSMTTYNGNGQKSCAALCANWSINFGQYNMSSHCCASDRCNNATDSNSDNGRMCYTCSDPNCSNTQTLKCKGDENQCITAAVGLNGTNSTVKGCASQNICNNSALVNPALPPGLIIFSVSCLNANNTQNTTQGPVNNAQSTTQGLCLLVPVLGNLLFFHLRSVLGSWFY